jgi:speckle-type POZ protein
VIQVDGIEPRVFKALLHFVYTDSLLEIEEGDEIIPMAQHLLVAADRYNLERMKLLCEVMLHNHMNTSMAATTLVLAEQPGCKGLKEACLKFIASPCNLKVVMASDGFEHLARSCPYLFRDLAANLAA